MLIFNPWLAVFVSGNGPLKGSGDDLFSPEQEDKLTKRFPESPTITAVSSMNVHRDKVKGACVSVRAYYRLRSIVFSERKSLPAESLTESAHRRSIINASTEMRNT